MSGLPGYDAYKLAYPARYDSEECCGHPQHFGICEAIQEGARCPQGCKGGLLVPVEGVLGGWLVCDGKGRHFVRPCDCVTCHTCGRAECEECL